MWKCVKNGEGAKKNLTHRITIERRGVARKKLEGMGFREFSIDFECILNSAF